MMLAIKNKSGATTDFNKLQNLELILLSKQANGRISCHLLASIELNQVPTPETPEELQAFVHQLHGDNPKKILNIVVPPQLLQQIDLEFLQQVATMLSVIAIAYVTSKNTHITLSEFIETMFENKMIMMTEYQKLTSEYLQELFTVPELWSTFDKQLKGNVKETMH